MTVDRWSSYSSSLWVIRESPNIPVFCQSNALDHHSPQTPCYVRQPFTPWLSCTSSFLGCPVHVSISPWTSLFLKCVRTTVTFANHVKPSTSTNWLKKRLHHTTLGSLSCVLWGEWTPSRTKNKTSQRVDVFPHTSGKPNLERRSESPGKQLNETRHRQVEACSKCFGRIQSDADNIPYS